MDVVTDSFIMQGQFHGTFLRWTWSQIPSSCKLSSTALFWDGCGHRFLHHASSVPLRSSEMDVVTDPLIMQAQFHGALLRWTWSQIPSSCKLSSKALFWDGRGHRFLHHEVSGKASSLHEEQWGQTNRNVKFWSRERFIAGSRRTDAFASKTLNSLKGFSKAFLKVSWGRDVVGCCKHFGTGILCSCSYPGRSSHHLPINLQQDERYSLSATW